MSQAKFIPSRFTVSPHLGKAGSRAFTLVELLVVMALAAILLGLVAPAVTSRLGGSELNRAGQMVSDTLSLAHQQAVKSNIEVFVVFYQLSDNNGVTSWRGVQACTMNRSTTTPTVVPIGKMIVLPAGTEISTAVTKVGKNFSPPLDKPVANGVRSLPGYGDNVKWVGFRFRADGSLDRDIAPNNNYLTVVSSKENGKASDQRNYYTMQINPVTGMVRTLRP